VNCGIYKITNLINKRIYIGSSVDIYHRYLSHKSHLKRQIHCNIKLQRSWNKYGENCFTFETILFCEKKDLLLYEQIAIDFYDCVKHGYNIAPFAASTLGRKHTATSKIKMSKSRKGVTKGPLSEQHKKSLSLALSGKVYSAERIEKIRIANTGRKASEETKMKMSIIRKGRKLSPEAKEKIALKNKERGKFQRGIRLSEETKKRMSLAGRGKTQSVDHVRKRRESNIISRMRKSHRNTSVARARYCGGEIKHEKDTNKRASK